MKPGEGAHAEWLREFDSRGPAVGFLGEVARSMRIWFSSAGRSLVLSVFVLSLTTGLSLNTVQAQPGRSRLRNIPDSLLLDIDTTATKKFATVQNHLRVGQLAEAVELLRNIQDTHTGKLVAVEKGRYVNVPQYVQMLTAGLPPEGLKIYREQTDPVLRPAFDLARETNDETALRKILQQGYCSSFGDEILLLLGDMAWDRGEIWRAQGWWIQLLPPARPKLAGDPTPYIAYPDTDLDQALILGRLILANIHADRVRKAEAELSDFRERFGTSEGRLAGRQGNLATILNEILQEAKSAPRPIRTSEVSTFAGDASRGAVFSSRPDLQRVRWSQKLKEFGDEPRRGFIRPLSGLCYFPVVYGDIVLLNNDEEIYAYRLGTGDAAWSDNPHDAKIYSIGIGGPAPEGIGQVFGEGAIGSIGLARYTMTIADGRLFARMGSVRPYASDRGGLIVCLDLAQGEGKLVWETYAASIEQEVGGWIFEGSPVVANDRVYMALRRMSPQPQSNIACFDAATGKLLWNRKICVGASNPNFNEFDVNQHLLTWGEGTLYYATHMGAVAAIEAETGLLKWVISYPRVEDTKQRLELSRRLQRGPLPALFDAGTVYVAPLDSNELLGIDAGTGIIKWRKTLPTPVQSLLGVSRGLLIAAGSEIWGLAAESGNIVWKAGDADPESYAYGRGALVESSIYWTTHEELYILDQQTGSVQQRVPLFDLHGQHGGNLTVTEGHLLIAQPDQLTVFANYSRIREELQVPRLEYSHNSSAAARDWQRALLAQADRDWPHAAKLFQAVRSQADGADEWQGRPLVERAARREFECRLQWARQESLQTPQSAGQLFDSALASAPDTATKALGLAVAVETLKNPESSHQIRFANPLLRLARETAFQIKRSGNPNLDLGEWCRQELIPPNRDSIETPPHSELSALHNALQCNDLHAAKSLVNGVGNFDATTTGLLQQVSSHNRTKSPDLVAGLLKQIVHQLPQPEQRSTAFEELARVEEVRSNWYLAAQAWKAAAGEVGIDRQMASENGPIPLSEWVHHHLAKTEYDSQRLLTEHSHLPWPLTRHWTRRFSDHCQVVNPIGTPPSLEAACFLIDQPPVACINLSDGSTRWELNLTHPLRWAGCASDKLVLVTEREIRVVASKTGTTVWSRYLQTPIERSSFTTSIVPSNKASFLSESRAEQKAPWRVTVEREPRLETSEGTLDDVCLIDSTLIVRQGQKRIIAWDIELGRSLWSYESIGKLAPQWSATPEQIVLCETSPPSLFVLATRTGNLKSYCLTESAPWTSAPSTRENGSLLTVGQYGWIEAWARPGAAWQSEEGPRAWRWDGEISISHQAPQVHSYPGADFVLVDGNTLICIDPLKGETQWKMGVGQHLIKQIKTALTCDTQQIYVAASGILRAHELLTGKLVWETYLGAPSLDWQVQVFGNAVIASPQNLSPAVSTAVVICDKSSGLMKQKLAVRETQGRVQFHPTAHTSLLCCGNLVSGLVK